MRRKSERTAGKKSKASPEKTEKKVDKPKRTRSRRKKQSTSSDNESADDASPVPEDPVVAVPEPEPKPPTTPVKGESPEESQDQVWQVKTAAAGDVGEIQKIKICLTRPPSTPERAERSPRSKRKHSRATSSSDTPSVEGPEERRKSRHRSKRSHRESKDDSEKNIDSQGEEIEAAADSQEKNDDEVTQSEEKQKADTSATSENTISTSDEKKPKEDQVESKTCEEKEDKKDKVESSDDISGKGEGTTEKPDKSSDADTTVVSPKAETTAVSAPVEVESSANTESQDSQYDGSTSDMASHSQSPARRRSMSVDKSEILELHFEESKLESDLDLDKTKADDTMEDANTSQEEKQVSKTEEKTPIKETMSDYDKSNITGVVEKSKKTRNITDSRNDARKSTDNKEESKDRRSSRSIETSNDLNKLQETKPEDNHKALDRSDSILSNHEEAIHNGDVIIPIVVSRKRRWGSRPAKITTQKSITISTDILKDIIPDVMPVEFEEVIEEKKHKREREVVEKIERPVLPKIIIDNTENIDRNIEHRRHSGEKDRDRDMKPKEPQISANRKISIIKDNDSIIARPPSPPRHKQSCVLYITNLVRPFTLPQLKNLLQRTGRLVENGFWIDKIKSKCYVIYENEDQAVETRHALHGVTWPVSNPKTLQVDFSTQEAFEKAKSNEAADNAQVSTIPGTVEDWLREQDMKRERGELEKPWERKVATREWDLGKNDKDKEKEKPDKRREEQRPLEKRRHNRTPERSPEPARKFKKKEEEPPAKLLDDLFKKTKATPCIYWLPLSAETIAIKEEQRRQHMAEHERRMLEQRTRAARRH